MHLLIVTGVDTTVFQHPRSSLRGLFQPSWCFIPWFQVTAGCLCPMLAAAGMMQVILSHLALCFSLNTQRQSQSEPIHLSIHHRKVVNTINLGFAPFLLALFKVIPFLSHPSFVGACPWSTCIWKFSFLRRKNKDRSVFFSLAGSGTCLGSLPGFHVTLPSPWREECLWFFSCSAQTLGDPCVC